MDVHGREVATLETLGSSEEGSPGGKYLSIVPRLGTGVTNETTTMRTAEPITIGTTGRKP
jgi:hypothetical protein